MYKCQLCGAIVPKRTSCRKVVLATRKKDYPSRRKANPGFDRRGESYLRSNRNSDRNDDRGGTGYETIKEINACDACAKSHKEANQLR